VRCTIGPVHEGIEEAGTKLVTKAGGIYSFLHDPDVKVKHLQDFATDPSGGLVYRKRSRQQACGGSPGRTFGIKQPIDSIPRWIFQRRTNAQSVVAGFPSVFRSEAATGFAG
jgi:hypothetical protein